MQLFKLPLIKSSVLLVSSLFIFGCSTQFRSNIEHNVHLLEKVPLVQQGLTFITPTTITGMEQDKQYLALTFSHALKKARPELRISDLSKTLGMINQANLEDEYQKMYEDYNETGIFNKSTLKKIGSLTNSRYICQLKLSYFKSKAQGRWSILGLTVYDTESANLRLFVQIWDATTGIIVWEAAQELTYAYDTTSEDPVTFSNMIHLAAKDIAKALP